LRTLTIMASLEAIAEDGEIIEEPRASVKAQSSSGNLPAPNLNNTSTVSVATASSSAPDIIEETQPIDEDAVEAKMVEEETALLDAPLQERPEPVPEDILEPYQESEYCETELDIDGMIHCNS
jgi:hypothetical protein